MWFLRAWKCEARLWPVFWLMGFVTVLPMIIGMPIIQLAFHSTPKTALGITILWILFLQGFYCLCVWKCAFNCGWHGWAYIARVLTVLMLLGVLGNLVGTMRFLWDKNYQVTLSGGNQQSLTLNGEPLEPKPSGAPVAAPATTLMMSPATEACEKRMADHAVSKGGDPKAYIAKNQAYLQQCVQVMTNQGKKNP